ncbi:MAG: T9SS type A sorting domain-containing protein [Bacteroidetes bacterium]|nr:T9SS type A sorting domain-containing protein [Bacteroidota bacterium]
MRTKILILIPIALLSFLAAMAQWSPRVKLSPGSIAAGLNENMGPCLVACGDTLNVVWSDIRTQGSAIYYAHSSDRGLNWSNPVPLTDTTGSASFPAIAISGSTVHLVWFDSPNAWYKRSVDGGANWNPAVLLDGSSTFWPGIAASDSVITVALNIDVSTSNSEIFLIQSVNSGVSWGPEVRFTSADGRSEDPAIRAQGSQIHMVWNDKRNGNMQTYYARSLDYGHTWDQNMSLINGGAMSYCPMVSLNGTYVDVPCGDTRSGNYDIWLKQSSDSGTSWNPEKQLTTDPLTEAYPYLVRDSMRLHLVFIRWNSGAMYMKSLDGGASWDDPVLLGHGGQPFIAFTGCVLHTIWPDSGSIWYSRNPTGNCGSGTSVQEEQSSHSRGLNLNIQPNVFSEKTRIVFTLTGNGPVMITIYDLRGNEVAVIPEQGNRGLNQVSFNASGFPPGIYFCRLNASGATQTAKLVITK